MRDAPQRTVRIPFKITSTGLVRLDGLPLPSLRDGTVLDLLVPLEAFTKQEELAPYLNERVEDIAPEGTKVLLGLSPGSIPPNRLENLIHSSKLPFHSPYVFIELELVADLKLRVQPGKPGQLEKCKCVILALDKPAASLNHAFTTASEHYETNRMAHTANVFTRTYLHLGGDWVLLEDIRKKLCAAT